MPRFCLLSLVAMALPYMSAFGQIPANDDFASATVINTLPYSDSTATTVGATFQAGEPEHASFFGNLSSNSVWWRYTPVTSEVVGISATGAGYDHVISVYTGPTLASLSVVTAVDDFELDDEFTYFQAQAGVTYSIVVDGYSGDGINAESGAFTLDVDVLPPPSNDDFSNAEVLSGLPVLGTTADLRAATSEPGEPDHASGVFGNVANRSGWYRWQAPSSGTVTVSGFGSDFDTDVVLSVYTGNTLGELTVVDESDLGGGGVRESVTFEAVAGTEYRIAVDVWSDTVPGAAGGEVNLDILAPPANDDFSAALDMGTTLPFTEFSSTTGATFEAGEPDHGFNAPGMNVASASVWWKWEAPATETILVEGLDYDGDMVISVYTGNSLGSLVEAGSANRSGLFGSERVYFQATAGTSYYIAVDAYSFSSSKSSSYAGDFEISVSSSQPNDAFENAEDLGNGLSVVRSGDTTNATSEFQFEEPEHANAIFGNLSSNSVWYAWTAPSAAEVTMTAAGGFDSVLAVYTGVDLATLFLVAESDSGESGDAESVTFTAAAGQRYVIAVDGWSGDGFVQNEGSFTLSIDGSAVVDAYAQWIAGYPSLTGDDALPEGNPSKDGVANLVKLVLGLDPTIPFSRDPNRVNMPVLVPYQSGFGLQYTVVPGNLGSTEIIHYGEVSNELASWIVSTPVNTGGNVWVIPVPTGSEAYVRLTVRQVAN